MPEHSKEDRTEAATPKRREKAKDEGNVPKSRDLSSVAVLFAGIFLLKFTSLDLFEGLKQYLVWAYQNLVFTELTPTSIPGQVYAMVEYFGATMLPFFIILMLISVGINVMQVGVVFAKKALIPKLNRVSPLKGFQRLFSMRSIVELLKGFLKIGIVSYVAYAVLKKHLVDHWALSHMYTGEVMLFIAQVLMELAIKVGLALLVLAVADLLYQRWDHEKNLKMTKQEVKEEMKQYEGNPEIKGRIRSIQRQMSRKRMIAAIPDATVVVTNPTHIAVALKYEPESTSDAPVVVAKGLRKIAEKIKAIARENDVPIIENRSLARNLYDTTEVGSEIPVVFYQAVAEILAQVYSLNPPERKVNPELSYA